MSWRIVLTSGSESGHTGTLTPKGKYAKDVPRRRPGRGSLAFCKCEICFLGARVRLDRKFAAVRIFDSSNVAIPYVRRSAFKLDGFPPPAVGLFPFMRGMR
jgi:hypothetical protein